MSRKTRVLLVDDHEDFRHEVRQLLEPEFEVVGVAADGKAALDAVELLSPDVAVLDVQMPVMGGIEAARRLSQRSAGVRVVLLSSHQSPALIREALSTGALGYVFKVSAVEDLGQSIRAAFEGQTFVSSSSTFAGNLPTTQQ